MIDLHVHSTFSDGSLTPAQLVERAAEVGLTAIALTDHDCTDGLDLFLAASASARVIGITGVEISADVPRGTMHVLGYCMDHTDAGLNEALRKICHGREIRNRAILDKLNGLGLKLAWEDVAKFAGEDVVGRPHFAQALVEKGLVNSVRAAFEKYLAKGKPAYEDRFRFSPADCIVAITNAGGIAALAHPFTLELNGKNLREYVAELKDMGLQGIEAYYSEHSDRQLEEYLDIARDLGLVITGGSDFHGDINPKIALGKGFGSLKVPDELAEGLIAAAKGRSG